MTIHSTPSVSKRLLAAAVLVCVAAVHSTAVAQSGGATNKKSEEEKKPLNAADAAKAKREAKRKPFVMLPKPLNEVESNAPAFGDSNIFKIMKAELDFVEDTQQRGLVWTLRVQRRVTARRALLLLKNLRDARFYYQGEITKRRRLIHQTVLEYPSLLDDMASRGKRLLPTEEIKVWVPLTDVERRRVVGMQANLLELSRKKKPLD